MKALALEHLESDPVGIFGEVLAERGITVDRARLHAGDPVPDRRGYDLVVAMGAGVSVWQEDEYPWIADEKRLVREAVLAGLPYFGICFGVQLLADVFGAHSFPGPEPEIGINQVFLTAAAATDPVFRGFPADLEVCEWHSNHFSLPAGAVRLARSPRYENQAIRYGRVAYGLQSHLEPHLGDIRSWLEEFPETAVTFEERHGTGAVARLLDDYADFVPFLQETARQLFGRWLQHALAFGAMTAAPSGMAPATALVGRGPELRRISAAISSARRGESSVLVLRGEPGIGKTALLDTAAQLAGDLRVLRATGEHATESDRPFAAITDLLRPRAELGGDPAPVRADALASVLEPQASAGAADRYTIYAAVFELLVAVAAQIPLLLVIDDAHLLDEASREAVAFIARRLGTDAISMIVATESDEELAFAEELRLGGLDPRNARALLGRRWGRELAPAVTEAVVAAAAGNPLALTEIPAELSPAQRAGEAALDGTLPPSAEWAFLRRISALPIPARLALLVAALAAHEGEQAVSAACRALGLPDDALPAALAGGLVRDGGPGVRFIHPLARTVVSYSALRADRRAVHAAIAGVVGGESGVWHRARAATQADETVASELERIALRARDRAAFAAAAAAFERAARLTPSPDARARRLLEAGRDAHRAGHINAALDHVDGALRDGAAAITRREARHLRGRVLARSGSAQMARDQLVSAAAACERDEPAVAAQMLADAALPTLRAGDPAEAVRVADRACRLANGASDAVRLAAQTAHGSALIFAGEFERGTSQLDHALAVADRIGDLQLAYLGAGLALAGRHADAHRILERVIDSARANATISVLPYALVRLADVELETGRWAAAAAALHEAAALARDTGQPADHGLAVGSLAWLAGARGHADECRTLARDAMQIARRLGSGSLLGRGAIAVAMLELGKGNPEAAIPPLEDACRRQDEQGWSDAARTPHQRTELVEAYALAGRGDEASAALELFRVDAERCRRASALAALHRCRILIADDSELDAAYAAARRAASAAGVPFEQARADLLYATRLTEQGDRDGALPILAGALSAFEELAAHSWAQRAQDVMLATGGAPAPPRVSRADRLTARELEVTLAAATGASPAEIAERLILGPRTVEMQLASASIKLGIAAAPGVQDWRRASAAPGLSRDR